MFPMPTTLQELWDITPVQENHTNNSTFGIASGNPNKVAAIEDVVSSFHGRIVDVEPADEDAIKVILENQFAKRTHPTDLYPGLDTHRIREITELKAVHTALNSQADYVVALDTGVYLNFPEIGLEPLGHPIDKEDLRKMLKRVSGNNISVHTSCAIADKSGQVYSDTISLNLVLDNFNIKDYVTRFGDQVIEKVAGGIDYANRYVQHLFNSNKNIMIRRFQRYSPSLTKDQIISMGFPVKINNDEAHQSLEEYFHGHPKQLIEQTIYHGIAELERRSNLHCYNYSTRYALS